VTFHFLAGNVALDFVATVASRETDAVELIPDPAALAEWLERAGILSLVPSVTDEEWQRAISLREELYALLRSVDRGDQPAPVGILNAAAEVPPPVPVLNGLHVERAGGVDAALSVITRAAMSALGDPRRRWCDGEGCTRAFIDVSRGRTRRWCGMAGCGDRAKAASYRRRKASAAHTG
jgi:predicted RNA-binding Zn ribbon-like protein